MSSTEIQIEDTRGEEAGRHARDIERVARDVFGWDPLRPGLARAVAAVLGGHDVLGVMPTGYGKSAAYRIAGALLPGTTLVVSPLIALQADQLAHLAETDGARPARLVNSAQPKARTEEAWSMLEAGELGYLFLAPEQLANEEVVARLAAAPISLLAVDEAHCVSSWGHDFRPDYLRLGEVAERLPAPPQVPDAPRPPILALTATGSRPVREEIVERLRMRDPRILIHGFDRPNIGLKVVRHTDEHEQVAAVLDDVAALPAPGLLYVGTRRATEEYAAALQERGVAADGYHGGLPAKRRRELSAAFHEGDVAVMVATSAFGMGIDKADVRFVVHAAAPESVDEYYQEVGRAGRDGEPAVATLHHRPEDLALRKFFASAVPKAKDLKALLLALRDDPDIRAAGERAGLSGRRASALAALFEEAGVFSIEDGRAVSGERPIVADEAVRAALEQAEARRRIDESRLAMMRSYAETTQCRRQFLLGYFGDEDTQLCHACDNCFSGAAERYAEARAVDGDGDGSIPFPIDTAVRHAEWGDGRVMSVEDDRITVFFASEGYRVLSIAAVTEHDLLTVLTGAVTSPSGAGRSVERMSDARTDDIDPDATGEGADLGSADPVTGVPNGDGGLDGEAVLPDDPDDDLAGGDPLALRAESMDTVTNDAVAGDTVLPGPGDGNDGPTGGAPVEFEPILPDNELAGQDIDLDDER
ncbi:MAG TPA: RecQ family ATP-dependent DNA helicase [Amnibacterium sp.]|uniref:RecQ family ATP-dependent DNA helicase n=1 Tax=Amnibacterium sp. TaxID=1872496 RepID=UPI002F92AB9C